MLKRHTQNVVVNFDPDAAGANAAEKSIALLTEEGFNLKLVTLDGGLDPDRFIRERGVEAYTQAVLGARRQSDYLIERARQMFPGVAAEQKLKKVNYLLPHIRRIPHELVRLEFVRDASQKLEIDSAIMLKEMRQAALKRREHIEVRTTALTEVERVLLRAVAITSPEHEDARRTAMDAITRQSQWFEVLAAWPALQALAGRGSRDPMDVVEDSGQRALMAEALLGETEPPAAETVLGAVVSLQQRKIEADLRDVRAQIAEAERRGDYAELALLTQRKLEFDRALRQLRTSAPASR